MVTRQRQISLHEEETKGLTNSNSLNKVDNQLVLDTTNYYDNCDSDKLHKSPNIDDEIVFSNYYNFKVTLPTIIATIIYIITLQGCYDSQFECLAKYNGPILRTLSVLVLLASFLFSLQFYLQVLRISKSRHTYFAILLIFFLCFIYDTGTNLRSHGGYNRIVLLLFMVLCLSVFSILHCMFCFSKKRGVLIFITLLTTILFVKSKIDKIIEVSCDGWSDGFKGTKIDNSGFHECIIEPPKVCYFVIFAGTIDFSNYMGETCENQGTNKFSVIEPHLIPELKKAKLLGYPLTNEWLLFPDSCEDNLQKKVMANMIDMEKANKTIIDKTEAIVDFRKNPPELKVELKKNYTLIKERIEVFNKYNRPDVKKMTKNVLYLFIDSLSRVNFKRKLPKFWKWLEGKYIKEGDDKNINWDYGKPEPPKTQKTQNSKKTKKTKKTKTKNKTRKFKRRNQTSKYRNESDINRNESEKYIKKLNKNINKTHDKFKSLINRDNTPKTNNKQYKKPPQTEVFQFFKYHGVGQFTGINMVPTYFGTFNNDVNGYFFLKHYRDSGYISGQSITCCNREVFDLGPGAIEEMDWEYWDHELISPMCDTNFTPYESASSILFGPNSIRKRCLYGKPLHSYALEYMHQFFEAYNDQNKVFRFGFAEAHEGTIEVIKYMDDDITESFMEFERKGYLNDTIIFIQADHGLSMVGPYQAMELEDWKVELVLPAFYMILPTHIENYQQIRNIMKSNENSIITPFNIYNSLLCTIGLTNKIGKFYSDEDVEHDIFHSHIEPSRGCEAFTTENFVVYDWAPFRCRCSKENDW